MRNHLIQSQTGNVECEPGTFRQLECVARRAEDTQRPALLLNTKGTRLCSVLRTRHGERTLKEASLILAGVVKIG